MGRLTCVLAGVLAFAARPALGEDICIAYGATVDMVVPSHFSLLPVEPPEPGSQVSGTVTFDTDAELLPHSAEVLYRVPRLDITLRIGDVESRPLPAADQTRRLVSVFDSRAGEGSDFVGLSGETTFSALQEPQAGLVLFRLVLEDPHGTALESDDFPAALDPSSFSIVRLETRTLPGDFRSLLFDAEGGALLDCDDASRPFQRGDVNSDGGVDLSDPIALLRFLFLGEAQPGCLKSADSNDDGALDISDGVFVFRRLFLGGPPIPAPGLDCGRDPTFDGLSCESAPRCEGRGSSRAVSIPRASWRSGGSSSSSRVTGRRPS